MRTAALELCRIPLAEHISLQMELNGPCHIWVLGRNDQSLGRVLAAGLEHAFQCEYRLFFCGCSLCCNLLELVQHRAMWLTNRRACSCCHASYLHFPSQELIQLSYVTPWNHWQLGLGWCVVCFNNRCLWPGRYTQPAQTCFSLAHTLCAELTNSLTEVCSKSACKWPPGDPRFRFD